MSMVADLSFPDVSMADGSDDSHSSTPHDISFERRIQDTTTALQQFVATRDPALSQKNPSVELQNLDSVVVRLSTSV